MAGTWEVVGFDIAAVVAGDAAKFDIAFAVDNRSVAVAVESIVADTTTNLRLWLGDADDL